VLINAACGHDENKLLVCQHAAALNTTIGVRVCMCVRMHVCVRVSVCMCLSVSVCVFVFVPPPAPKPYSRMQVIEYVNVTEYSTCALRVHTCMCASLSLPPSPPLCLSLSLSLYVIGRILLKAMDEHAQDAGVQVCVVVS
jgi:hypothetical protein